MNDSLKIAIIADWLIDFGGAELVISHLLEMYPDADIFTSVCFMDHPMLEGRRVYTSWVQKIPYLNRKHKLAGLLRPWAFRSFDLSAYDVIICSSSAESKQVSMGKWNRDCHVNKRRQLAQKNKSLGILNTHLDSSFHSEGRIQQKSHKPIVICYCHTPIRYYWSHAKEYEDMMEFGLLNPLVKAVFRLVKGWMQRVDYAAAQKVDFFIANSCTTAERIKQYYHRDSEVIYPGVSIPDHCERNVVEYGNPENQIDVQKPENGLVISSQSQEQAEGLGQVPYFLGLGRCIPYKKFDLLVDAFNVNGKKLILCTATDTALYRELKEKSGPNIEWKFRPSDTEKFELMQNARAFLFPPEEDFGLVPVEAMMMGTPVIAYGKGGATESVEAGKTGIFFSPQTPEALNIALEEFEKIHWNITVIREHAQKFGKVVFQEKIRTFLEKNIGRQ